jgi:hypothetical protein
MRSDPASQFHARFRTKFWNHRHAAQRHSESGASEQAGGQSDPFVEYIQFKYGGFTFRQGFEYDWFDAFQVCKARW